MEIAIGKRRWLFGGGYDVLDYSKRNAFGIPLRLAWFRHLDDAQEFVKADRYA